jgi:hypothetical protein
MIHHGPGQLNDALYGWRDDARTGHLRAGAVLWQPKASAASIRRSDFLPGTMENCTNDRWQVERGASEYATA